MTHQFYDHDIMDIRVHSGKIFIELMAPMEEVILTKEDLLHMLDIIDGVEQVVVMTNSIHLVMR